MVHKEFICYYSPVLRAAFNSPFIEGEAQTYTIEDTSAGSFRFLVQWIYQQKLDVGQLQSQSRQDMLTETDIDWKASEEPSLLELWVLADKFCISKLQNVAISIIVTLSNTHSCRPDLSRFPYIYENTVDGSPLRRFVLDICYHLEPEVFLENADYFPRELLAEYAVLNQNIRFRGNDKPPCKLLCENYFVELADEDK